MTHFVIDIGNTRIKLAEFSERELLGAKIFESAEVVVNHLLSLKPRKVLISSVSQAASDTIVEGIGTAFQVSFLNKKQELPFQHCYTTPETLGDDRIAGVLGARSLFPKTSVLVIDAGTCITYDFVDHKGLYHGGAISPGITMRFKALHEFTSALPMVKLAKDEGVPAFGDSTSSCIKAGVINGCVAEIKEAIHQYLTLEHELRVVICGGDAPRFVKFLQGQVLHFSDLILLGINERFLSE